MGTSHIRPAFRRMLVCAACLLLLFTIAAQAALSAAVVGAAEATEAVEIKNSSQILMPAPSGKKKATFQKAGVTIDYGNASQGYVMIKHEETDEGLKVRITLGEMQYTYDLNGHNEFEVFPLQMGNGKYNIQIFVHVTGNYYDLLTERAISVVLDDPYIAYLYPSQYVNYTAESRVVAKSNALCEGLETDREKVKAIYNFCGRRINYDYIFAIRPKKGYLPDVDSVLDARKGICFDYAALMASMLRAQGIPTMLVIGYADRSYHAWNNVLVDGKWYRFDATSVSASITASNYREERHY